MAKKYKSKPVVIEAMELSGGSAESVMKWIDDYGGLSRPLTGGRLLITTLEGDMIAGKGDFIIKGLLNEFYPCKAEVFKQKYEEVES
jgi:hypothetical protein